MMIEFSKAVSRLIFLFLILSILACSKNKQVPGAQPDAPPPSAQIDLKDANRLLSQKRCDQAIPLYEKFLGKYAMDSGVWNLLGLAYLCNASPQRAVEAFNKALQITPTYTDVHNNLGVAHTELKNYTEARNEFLTALQDVAYPPAGPYFNLAKLAFVQGNYEESRALAKKVVERNRAAGPILLYALSLEKLGRIEEACDSYRDLLKVAPDNLEGSYYLANLLLIKHQDCEAREYFRRVIDSDPLGELGQKSIQALKTLNCPN